MIKQKNKQIFHIEKLKRDPLFQMKENHFHPYYELFYLLSGKRKYFINHSFYTLTPFDVILINKGDLHRTTYVCQKNYERIVLYFDDSDLAPLFKYYGKSMILSIFQRPKLSIPSDKHFYMDHLFDKMITEYHKQDIFSSQLISQLLQELIIFLIRYRRDGMKDNENTGSVEADIQQPDSDIQQAAKYICENYDSELTLDQVAQQINLSPTYFSKKFKNKTGFGFKEYLNQIRLKEATNQLIETTNTITEIALNCGFNDSNYFGDMFKKANGVSPREYRHLHQ